jgi:hypothetical protein
MRGLFYVLLGAFAIEVSTFSYPKNYSKVLYGEADGFFFILSVPLFPFGIL